ncbi:unnamed protein product [Cunninghamella blakesleeana]
MDTIQTVVNLSGEFEFSSILKNLGVIIAGSLLLPLLFIVTLNLLAFFIQAFAAGSIVALWMATMGKIKANNVFFGVQVITSKGLKLIIKPHFVVLQVILSLVGMIVLLCIYSFNLRYLFIDIVFYYKELLGYAIIGLNYILSIFVDLVFGIIFGSIIGFFISKIGECCCCCGCCCGSNQKYNDEEYLPIHNTNGHGNYENNNADSIPCLMRFLAFVGMWIGVYKGVTNPYEFI